MTKQELKDFFGSGAQTTIEYLQEGKDGFFCRDVIKYALIGQGKREGLDKEFPEAFAELKRYEPIYNGVGLVMVLEKFIEMLEKE